jgi:hypothetical protein
VTAFTEGQRVGRKMAATLSRGARARSRRPGLWMNIGRQLTAEYCPRANEFIDGLASGAELNYDDVFAVWFEELSDYRGDRGCSDIVIDRGVRDGVVIAHTNDVAPNTPVHVDRLDVPGAPTVTMVFSGGSPSAAANALGMVFSGNQVDSLDVRPGIPRQVLYFEACFSRDIESAARVLLHPLRASSFNNIVADARGRVVGLEASARQHRVLTPVDGVLAHTNHFLFLTGVEARTGDNIANSRRRMARISASVSRATTDDELLALMASHGEGGLCRHGQTETRFSVLFRPRRRDMLLGIGSPCRTRYRTVSM